MDYDSFLKSVCLNIKRLRIEKFQDRAFNDIGQEGKIKGTLWRKIEEGEKTPTFKNLLKIANALDVEIDEFFKFESSKIEREKLITALRDSDWELNGAAEKIGIEVPEIKNITANSQFRRDDPKIRD